MMEKALRSLTGGLVLLLLSCLLGTTAWSSPLLTLNGEAYSADDFRAWWRSWKEEGMEVPATPDAFIEWHLLAQEGLTMELDKLPSFEEKVRTFFKVRTMMQLKYDEVDSKVVVTDEEVDAIWQKDYRPITVVQGIMVKDKKAAEQTYRELQDGSLDFDGLNGRFTGEQGSHHIQNRTLLARDFQDLPEGDWRRVVADLEPGRVAPPVAYEGAYYLMRVKERIEPTEEQRDQQMKNIRATLFKERHGELTTRFVMHLREKFHTALDEKLMALADQEEIPDDMLEKHVLTSDVGGVPLRYLVEQIKIDKQLRKWTTLDDKELLRLKAGILYGEMDQQLVFAEAAERRYEEKEPLAPVYQFYRQNRLIRELEGRVIGKGISVSDEEVRSYYDTHPDEFTMPGTVTIAVLEDDRQLGDKLRAEFKKGEDFFAVVRKYYSREIEPNEVAVDKIDPKYRETVTSLNIGEVGGPIEVGGHVLFVKLVARKPGEPVPFEEVRQKINSSLRQEKYQKKRADYVTRLRELSKVKVDEGEWKKLSKELRN